MLGPSLVVFHSKVISVLEKSKLWSLALWVLSMMTDQKVTPDTITHNAAISSGPQVLTTLTTLDHSLHHTCSSMHDTNDTNDTIASFGSKRGSKVLVDHTGNTVWPCLKCSISKA